MNRISQWALNIAAGIFFFFFFLLLFFPFETFVRNFLSGFEQQTGGAYRITVSEITPHLIFKSVFKDFALHQLANGEDQVVVSLPEVRIGIRYLPLLSGSFEGSFEAHADKGQLSGSVDLAATESQFECSLKAVALKNFPSLSRWAKVPLSGQISGIISGSFFKGQSARNVATLDLKIEQFKLAESHITPVAGFDLDIPETYLAHTSPGGIKASLEKDTLTLKEFNFPGEDISLTLTGTLRLNPQFALSRLNVSGDFGLSDKVAQAIPVLVMIEKQKNEQGRYPLEVSGGLAHPSLKIGTFSPF